MGLCGSSAAKVHILPEGVLPDGVEQLQRTPEESDAVVKILTESFCGTATAQPELVFSWCLGEELEAKFDDQAARHEKMSWVLKFMTSDAWAAGEKGCVLVCRKPDGGIGGIALLKIYRGKAGDSMSSMHRAATWSGGRSKTQLEYCNNPRMKAFDGTIKKLQKQWRKGEVVEVVAVAVDTSAQGQGMGGKLMRAASAIADKEGLACYLECNGERNPQIYKKYGYEVKGEEEIRTKKGEVFPHKCIAMVRPKSVA